MIVGAHSIIYSRDPERDRLFLKDVLELPSRDVGDGWLIFDLPPAEVAVHPSDRNNVHEFYLLTDDVAALLVKLNQQGIPCSPPQTMAWGVLTQVTLPGGGRLGIYEPRHARPGTVRPKRRTTASAVQPSKAKRTVRRGASGRGRRNSAKTKR